MAAVASPYIIRPMTLADIPHVSEIERESFPTTWPQMAYKRELQQNAMARYLVVGERTAPIDSASTASSSRGLGSLVRRVLTRPSPSLLGEESLAAFVGLWFMLEECHIVTVAVRESRRRHGLGELLVITSIEMALQREQNVLTLECRVSNTTAQSLYEKYGFERAGIRKRYYTDDNEDALIMTTPNIRTADYQSLFQRLRTAHHERWGVAQVALPET